MPSWYLIFRAAWNVTVGLAALAALIAFELVAADHHLGWWGSGISLGLGLATGQALFYGSYAVITLPTALKTERYRNLEVSVVQDDDGNFTAFASNRNVATSLKLPEGYNPAQDRGVLLTELLAREFGFK